MPEKARKKILLMITDAGGGHRGTALSLQVSIARMGLPWDVRIVNLYTEVWKKVDLAQLLFQVPGEEIYNFCMKRSMRRCTTLMHRLTPWFLRFQAPLAVKVTREFLAREKPDLVISLMPFVNDIYAEALAGTGIPLCVLVTDLVDTSSRIWFSPKACRQARFFAVGCPEALAQARALGAEKVFDCGLVIHPKFFDPGVRGLEKRQARRRMGLREGLFTPMILMGAYGGSAMTALIRQFEKSEATWQIVACCGKNRLLLSQLERLRPRLKNRLVPLGFTQELHLAMRASDLCITKPGPASLTEAMAMNVPLVLDDARTMIQEEANVDYVRDRGLGVVVGDRRDMLSVVEGLHRDGGRLRSFRRRLRTFAPKDAARPFLKAVESLFSRASIA